MSILKQSFIIECYNGTENTCNDIALLVKRDPRAFRLLYGTNFNVRKPPTDKYGYTISAFRLPFSAYMVDIFHNREFRGWEGDKNIGSYYDRTVTMLVDCKYIIRDGRGRIVHPDVIYQAFIARYGEKSTEHYLVNYFRRGLTKVPYDRDLRPTPRDRGAQARCWQDDRSDYKYKKLLVQMDESNNRSNMNDDELVESEYELIRAPEMRKGSIEGSYHGRYWDSPRRNTNKCWKSQCKIRKSWYKGLK